MALWGGRFTQAADQRFKQFNDSLRLRLPPGRTGYCRLCGLVQSAGDGGRTDRRRTITAGRGAVTICWKSYVLIPQQILESDAEDIHSWVEGKLIDKVGQLGKKLHTGRSRNDQSPPI